MDTKHPITIAYGGTLGFADSLVTSTSMLSRIKQYFWTYNHNKNFARSRSAYPLFAAMSAMCPEARSRFKIHLWGFIDDRNQKLAEAMGIGDVVLIEGLKSKHDTQQLLQEADMLYLPLESNTPDHETLFIPGKLFEYLSMKKPVLCFSDGSDASRILEASGLGLIFRPDEANECAQELSSIADDLEELKSHTPNEQLIESYRYSEKVKQLERIIYNVAER